MDEHQFQLVVQFAADTDEEKTDLINLTDELEELFSELPSVLIDGWDYGMGDFNIFIDTNHPTQLAPGMKKIIDIRRPGKQFSIGYRAFSEDHYVMVLPPDSPPLRNL